MTEDGKYIDLKQDITGVKPFVFEPDERPTHPCIVGNSTTARPEILIVGEQGAEVTDAINRLARASRKAASIMGVYGLTISMMDDIRTKEFILHPNDMLPQFTVQSDVNCSADKPKLIHNRKKHTRKRKLSKQARKRNR